MSYENKPSEERPKSPDPVPFGEAIRDMLGDDVVGSPEAYEREQVRKQLANLTEAELHVLDTAEERRTLIERAKAGEDINPEDTQLSGEIDMEARTRLSELKSDADETPPQSS